ncbi:MAG: membrane protein insertase YidC [Nitrospiraceae bacterium]|nr:MAG: membrane protein insertase YidC [Nitrospiraceae bacterium]
MEKNALLAIVLSLAVLILYQFFFAPPPPKVTEKEPPATEKEIATVQPETSAPEIVTPDAGIEERPRFDAIADREIHVENDLYTAVLSSRGASVKYWSLKTYKDEQGDNVVLLRAPGEVPAVAIGSNKEFNLASVNFRVSGGDLVLDSANSSGSIRFDYAGDNFSVRRTYTFYANTYKVHLTDEVSGLPHYWITVGSDFGIFDKKAGYSHVGPAVLTGTDLEELKPNKLKEMKVFTENLKWIAQEDKYFFAALAPVETPVLEARAWTFEDSPIIAFKGTPDRNTFILYAGPKEHDALKQVGVGLEHIIDFGFFSVLSRPLFWLLKWFYSFMGNYGWAIVLLTIVTRLPFIPIVNKGQKSMKKLQAIQPKMAEIKEKYKKDPQKMQKEMTGLYKKHKVNPVSGCLPMLIQLPVFFALYKVLLVAIELRGAPFLLWITDLSAKDPYYILPVVMGLTMLLQQKMTPSGMDPRQAKMMLLMPVVFTFLFLNFASGLVLYWLVNNILGIAQQFFVNRKITKEPA